MMFARCHSGFFRSLRKNTEISAMYSVDYGIPPGAPGYSQNDSIFALLVPKFNFGTQLGYEVEFRNQ